MTLEIAMRLQKLRKEKGLSQEELAEKLGVSRQAVSKWERAEASPDTDNLILLSRLYEISLDELLNSSETTEEIKEEQPFSDAAADSNRDESQSRETNGKNNQSSDMCSIIDENDNNSNLEKLADQYDYNTETDADANNSAWKLRRKKTTRITESVIVLITAVAYLLLGLLGNLWHPAWLVLFAIPVLTSLCEAVSNRDAKEFAYPIFITAVYLFVGCVYGIWHPTWVMFITIPLYYLVAEAFDKNK